MKPLGLLCPQGACFLGALSSLSQMGSLFLGLALEAWMTMGPCVLPVNAKGPVRGAPQSCLQVVRTSSLVLLVL